MNAEIQAQADRTAAFQIANTAARIAAINSANPAALPVEELTRLIDMAEIIRRALWDGHQAFQGDASMQARYLTSGKALARVLVGLRAKRGDQ